MAIISRTPEHCLKLHSPVIDEVVLDEDVSEERNQSEIKKYGI